MLLDQSIGLTVRAGWIIFIAVMLFLSLRAFFQDGFREVAQLWGRRRTVGTIGALLLLSLFSSSLVFVAPQNVGVVVSLMADDGTRERPSRSGLRWLVPLAEEMIIYPIYWQTYTMSLRPLEGNRTGDDAVIARTSDGQEVIIDLSVVFRLEVNQVIRIHIDWQNRYIEDFIRPYIRGIVRTEVSQFTIDEINSFKRRDLETRLDQLLREELEDKGFILDRFLLRNITFSGIYAASVEQKQVAFQQIIQARYEAERIRELASGKADEAVIAANAEATVQVVIANAEAEALQVVAGAINEQDDLLTYEYINKISPNVRVMLLPNDNPLILNLPDLEATPVLTTTFPLSQTVSLTPVPTSTLPTQADLGTFPTLTPTPLSDE